MALPNQIALDTAAFLDSSHAKNLEGITTGDLRRVATAFLIACYEDLGTKPHLLDGHDVHNVLGHILPGHLARADPIAPQVPSILEAMFKHLSEQHVLPHAFEMNQALATTADEFFETVRTGENAHHRIRKQEPVVNKVERLGRNDPCSCGSGKKYKKCHGRGQ